MAECLEGDRSRSEIGDRQVCSPSVTRTDPSTSRVERRRRDAGARTPDRWDGAAASRGGRGRKSLRAEVPETLALTENWSTTRRSYAVNNERTARRVKRVGGLDYVLGDACLNDISARDFSRGRAWAAAVARYVLPDRPSLVTADEIPIRGSRHRLSVDGETVQLANTRQMYSGWRHQQLLLAGVKPRTG